MRNPSERDIERFIDTARAEFKDYKQTLKDLDKEIRILKEKLEAEG